MASPSLKKALQGHEPFGKLQLKISCGIDPPPTQSMLSKVEGETGLPGNNGGNYKNVLNLRDVLYHAEQSTQKDMTVKKYRGKKSKVKFKRNHANQHNQKETFRGKKPLVFNSGFHAYVRPPLTLYRVQCNNDYIAEKSKKAEAAIRKLYKAAVGNSSTTSFKDTNTIFQHESSSEALLSQYRDNQIYTKSRLRKVNKKQLIKAMIMAKKKDEEEIRKQIDSAISKVEAESIANKQKSKQKRLGPLRVETKIFKMGKSMKPPTIIEPNKLDSRQHEEPSCVVLSGNKVREHDGEMPQLKPKCPLTVRRPTLTRKVNEATIRRRMDLCKEGPTEQNLISQHPEYPFREEEGETGSLLRKPIKQGNYTTIVTLKKKAMFKDESAADFGVVQLSNHRTGKSVGVCQKVKRDETTSNNEIEHMYKINEASFNMTNFFEGLSRNTTNRITENPDAKTRCEQKESKVLHEESVEPTEKGFPLGNGDLLGSGESNEDGTLKLLPMLTEAQHSTRKLPEYKYEVYKSITTVPRGLQVKQANAALPAIESSDGERSISSRYRAKKTAKREERYLSLPKITPSLTIDKPEVSSTRRKAVRMSTLRFGETSEVKFV